LDLHVTTPEAPVVQHQLRRMVDAGLTHCILESTSHGLAQRRVSAVDYDIAVVTNITHEHLDYHGTKKKYFEAKARLFHYLNLDDWALPTENESKKALVKTAVLNADDRSYKKLLKIGAPCQVSYALNKPADVTADDIAYTKNQTWFELHFPYPLGLSHGESQKPIMEFDVPGHSWLVGEFNLYNTLATVAAARVLEVSPEDIQASLKKMFNVKGRMERVTGWHDFIVVIDFAHTPNSLRKAIDAGRKMVKPHKGRVITVFGSAGKRDVEKRRLMAEISARYADISILTAEDPRTESLDDILEMMAEGCRNKKGVEGETFWRIPDRGQAIYFALNMAKKRDIVMVCGKGHEQSMCFGTIEYPWDEREALYAALKALQDGEPMPDLGLPTGKKMAE
jgi:UDP-N-acetylmuramoyl-L-alanyl-D-glutamate--2,6-diaminopimelate ligase